MGNEICCKDKDKNVTTIPTIENQTVCTQIKVVEIPQIVPLVNKQNLSYLADWLKLLSLKQQNFKKYQYGSQVYHGEISQNQLPHGIGKMYKTDNSIYIGYFKDGKAQGKGLFILPNGDYYQGDLRDNKAQSTLSKYVSSYYTYQGSFKQNTFNGEGKQWSDKHVFSGIYKDGYKQFGQLRWWNQSKQKDLYCYYGKFDQNGQFTQQGILEQPTGKYVGTFQKGKKHGEGVYIYNNNLRFEGQYKNGMKDGKGKVKFVHNQMLIFQGTWKKNLPDGDGIKYDQKGTKQITKFKEGINIATLIDPSVCSW